MIKGIHHVINRTQLTGHRSVIALPLAGSPSSAVDDAIEDAVKENIVTVVSAGG